MPRGDHAAYPRPMRFGITILPEHRWTEAAPLWRGAEEYGFDHAWTYDHLVWAGLPDSPWFGALPTLTAAATVTSTMRLGTFVSSPNYRHPYVFHRDLLTLDDISGGRLLCGLGTGGDLAVGGGFVWARVSGWLVSKIDPTTSEVVARYGPPAGSGSVAADETALWISAHDVDVVYRLPLR